MGKTYSLQPVAGTPVRMVCGYLPLSPGQESLGVLLAPVMAACTLPGLGHNFGLAPAKGILKGTGQQGNHVGGRVMVLVCEVATVSTVLVPTGVYLSSLGGGRKENGVLQLLCSWRSLPEIPGPPIHALRLVNTSLSCTTQAFLKLLLLCSISVGYLLCCLFKGKYSVSSALLALSEPSLLSIKIPSVKPYGL